MYTAIVKRISQLLSFLDENPRHGKWTAAIFATVYFLILSLQGLDFADEGFSLTFYQNIFSNPADVEYLFLYYLTGIFGGIWDSVFGVLGTYGFRILFSLTSGVTVLTAYSILIRFFKPSTVFLGCIACILWPGLCLYYFNHDCLTVLLYLLTSLFLLKGNDSNNTAWFCAGIFIALNIFTRVPNITLTILLLFPFIKAFCRKTGYRHAGLGSIYILGGILTGIATVIALMLILNHQSVFYSAVSSLFVMGNDATDTHSMQHFIKSYSYTYKGIITSTLYGSLIALSFIIAKQIFRHRIIRIIIGAVCMAAFYILLVRNIYALWGLLAAATILHLLLFYRDYHQVSLTFLAIVMLAVIPAGGDSYYNVCNSCQWLAMPILIYHLRNQLKWKFTVNRHSGKKLLSIENSSSTSQQITLCATGAFLVYVLLHSVCYFDNGSKFHKTYIPDLPSTTTFTSKERALLTESVVNAISKNGNGYDYMLVFDDAPMLHYLTGLRPYLGSPWGTFWGKEMFEKQLKRAENSSRQLPLITIPKFKYKDLSHTDFFDNNEQPKLSDKAAIITGFMQRHNYQIVHNDKYISIYKPTIKEFTQ